MTEKELRDIWWARFSDNAQDEYTIVLKKEKTDKTCLISYGMLDLSKQIYATFNYEWVSLLFQNAKEKLEDESCYVHSAYKIDKDYFLYVANKKNDFVYEISVDLNGGKNICYAVPSVLLLNEKQMMLLLSKEEREKITRGNKYYQKKEAQIMEFFVSWMNTKSEERLSLITQNKKVVKAT